MGTLQAIAIIVGVVSGVSGLVLGILNYWEHRVSTRPRIVVRLHAQKYDLGGPKIDALVEVCNVGSLPVMIEGIVWFQRTRGQKENLHIFPQDWLEENPKWPRELKPQHPAYLRFRADTLPEGRKLGRAFIETGVGDRFKASRRNMRRFVRQLDEFRLKQPLPASPCTPPQAAGTPA